MGDLILQSTTDRDKVFSGARKIIFICFLEARKQISRHFACHKHKKAPLVAAEEDTSDPQSDFSKDLAAWRDNYQILNEHSLLV